MPPRATGQCVSTRHMRSHGAALTPPCRAPASKGPATGSARSLSAPLAPILAFNVDRVGAPPHNGQRLDTARTDGVPGWVPEWLKGADCKSAGFGLRWFEPTPIHHVVCAHVVLRLNDRIPSTERPRAARFVAGPQVCRASADGRCAAGCPRSTAQRVAAPARDKALALDCRDCRDRFCRSNCSTDPFGGDHAATVVWKGRPRHLGAACKPHHLASRRRVRRHRRDGRYRWRGRMRGVSATLAPLPHQQRLRGRPRRVPDMLGIVVRPRAPARPMMAPHVRPLPPRMPS